MADRVLTWHIPVISGNGKRQGPTYYIEDDYEPLAVRIHAENAPSSGDLQIDILDDGVSIFNDKTTSYSKDTASDPYIEYHGRSTTDFTLGETIAGGTSGAKAKIKTNNGIGSMTLELIGSTSFSVAETITGETSAATATVDYYVRPATSTSTKQVANGTWIHLAMGDNYEEMAEDFIDTPIEKGSWVSLNVGNTNGASNISVHLELRRISETDEDEE